MDKQTQIWTDKQTNKQTDKQIDKHIKLDRRMNGLTKYTSP